MSIVMDKEDLADQMRKQTALKWCKKIITGLGSMNDARYVNTNQKEPPVLHPSQKIPIIIASVFQCADSRNQTICDRAYENDS